MKLENKKVDDNEFTLIFDNEIKNYNSESLE